MPLSGKADVGEWGGYLRTGDAGCGKKVDWTSQREQTSKRRSSMAPASVPVSRFLLPVPALLFLNDQL